MRSSRKEAPDSEQGSPVPAYSTPEVGVFFRDGHGIAPKVRSFLNEYSTTVNANLLNINRRF
jgi:hypothetical protein